MSLISTIIAVGILIVIITAIFWVGIYVVLPVVLFFMIVSAVVSLIRSFVPPRFQSRGHHMKKSQENQIIDVEFEEIK
ncbi:MAG: hypothetical protein II938_02135 [Alphaproteobacteria bacterium]|nr:hypothetical protein [Alphaproteobacteria bacterium]